MPNTIYEHILTLILKIYVLFYSAYIQQFIDIRYIILLFKTLIFIKLSNHVLNYAFFSLTYLNNNMF